MSHASPTPEPDDDIEPRDITLGPDSPDGPRYMNLPAGLIHGPKVQRNRFLDHLRRDAQQVSDMDLSAMLRPGGPGDWRPRLVAAYLIALDRRVQFRETIRGLLMASEVCYSGEGYCFALAAFGGHQDAAILMAYLDRYLPQLDRRYDQAWALGALLFLDHRLGAGYGAPYLADGSWERWAQAVPNRPDVVICQQTIETLCAL